MSPPWMPLYIADYLRDTTHLRGLESGAYLHLIMAYWVGGKLPDNDRQLATITKLTLPEWRRVRPVVEQFFHDGWKHKRVDAELARAADISSKRRASAEQRHGKRDANAPANGHANAHRLDTHARGSSPSQSHTPKEEAEGTRASALVVPADDWPADFRERFWQVYPNKVGKPLAIQKLELTRKTGRATWAALWSGLDAYVHKTDDRPWCNPATWINQQRWNDQPATAPKSGRDAQQQRSDDALEQLRAFNRHGNASSGADARLLLENSSERSEDFHRRGGEPDDELPGLGLPART
jgi:uncharacterized protein YdaU (DUF1376 family)